MTPPPLVKVTDYPRELATVDGTWDVAVYGHTVGPEWAVRHRGLDGFMHKAGPFRPTRDEAAEDYTTLWGAQ